MDTSSSYGFVLGVIVAVVGLIGFPLVAAVCVALLRCCVRRRSYRGKHVCVTGGSSGIGLEIACEYAQRGAHVTIVSRTVARLEQAIRRIEERRIDASQLFSMFACDVSQREEIESVLARASNEIGEIDTLVTCAGASVPGRFLLQSPEDGEKTMNGNYFGTLYPCRAYARRMVRLGRPGRICMVSSAAAFMTFVGYSSYAPSKFAIRGLAETLRNELLPYDIQVHILYPPDTHTPGYENENKTKPPECIEISKQGVVLSAREVAHEMLRGIDAGDFHIACELGSKILVYLGNSMAPRNNTFFEVLALPIFALIGLFVRRQTDSIARTQAPTISELNLEEESSELRPECDSDSTQSVDRTNLLNDSTD